MCRYNKGDRFFRYNKVDSSWKFLIVDLIIIKSQLLKLVYITEQFFKFAFVLV